MSLTVEPPRTIPDETGTTKSQAAKNSAARLRNTLLKRCDRQRDQPATLPTPPRERPKAIHQQTHHTPHQLSHGLEGHITDEEMSGKIIFSRVYHTYCNSGRNW